MKSHRTIRVLAAAAVVSLLAAACGDDDDDATSTEAPATEETSSAETAPADTATADTSTEETASEETAPEDTATATTSSDDEEEGAPADPTATMRLAATITPSQWDPHNGRSDAVDFHFMSPVYDQLLQFDNELNIIPGLATSWELSDDNKSLTLELMEGVTFHDGTPFNADAVVANFEYTKAAQNALTQTLMADTTAFTAVDEYTVRVDFATSGASWPLNLAFKIGLGGMVSPQALQDPATLATTPSGSGPYVLAGQTQDTATYEKADSYWNEELLERLPQTVELVGIADENARISALQSGQLDATLIFAPVPDEANIVDGEDILKWQAAVANRHILSYLNWQKQPLFNDPNVRRALSMAIDREALETLTGGTCVAPGQPMVEGNQGYNPDVSAETGAYAYDPEQARQLLADAGAEDLTLTATVVNTGIFTQLATAVQEMFADVGVTMTFEVVESSLSQESWRSGNFDISLQSTNSSPDPAFIIGTYYTMNPVFQPYGEDPELKAMHVEAAALPYGSPERDEAYQEIAAYINETPTLLHYCHWPPAGYYHSYLLGMEDQGWAQVTGVWDVRNLAIAEH